MNDLSNIAYSRRDKKNLKGKHSPILLRIGFSGGKLNSITMKSNPVLALGDGFSSFFNLVGPEISRLSYALKKHFRFIKVLPKMFVILLLLPKSALGKISLKKKFHLNKSSSLKFSIFQF